MTVLKIVRSSPLKLRFALPERYAGAVGIGQRVTLTVKAHADREFDGAVYFINPEVDAATHTLEVKAIVDNAAGALKPGFFVQVGLQIGVNDDAVLVAPGALMRRSGETVVFVVDGGRARQRSVTLGESIDGLVEILDGVGGTEPFVTAGQYQLFDGAAVRVLKHSAATGASATIPRVS